MATYIRNNKLSREAQACFELTFQILKEKAEREKAIPEELLFCTAQEGFDDANDELTAAGLQEYAFTDAHGNVVYRHKVDKELLREALGWDKQ